ncbi:MAG: NADH-quinone oxidoreductase subunit A [Deltaproteobacteria bacterium]|nr:NADH-quinone oxidoreductase subunit A [Deltaproteobacteria bacterium]
MNPYISVLILFAFAAVAVSAMIALAAFLGPKKITPVKLDPFECGMPPSGLSREPFSVKFYIVGLLFILFDIELVFLFPWAVLFKSLGWYGFAEMAVFLGVLVLGLIYVWKKGALEWD